MAACYAVLRHLHPSEPRQKLQARAVAMALNPLNFFYWFLFYTDPGSIFLVISAYAISLRGFDICASSVGTMAVMFRQNNVVWVALMMGLRLLAGFPSGPEIDATMNSQMAAVITHVWRRLYRVGLPYLTVLAGFLLFVLHNGSIVVGDRTAHEASLHVSMLMYFAAGNAIMDFPNSICVLKHINPRPTLRKVLVASFVTFTCTFVVKHFTIAHPYLLADNRHYTFYIWKKIINRHWFSRYLLVPLYATSWCIVWQGFSTWRVSNGPKLILMLRKAGVIFAISLVLVPAGLLEPRYFVLPMLLVQLHSKTPSLSLLQFQSAVFVVVNIATIYIFTEKPFLWPNQEVARFMW